MSNVFGAPPPSQPARPTGGSDDRRRKVLIPTLITLAVLLFLGSIFTSVWTDRLWFSALGFQQVFTTMLLTRVGLFLVFGLLFGLVVVGNLALAYRFRPDDAPLRRDDPAARYRQTLGPIIKPALIVVGLVLATFAGSVASSRWEEFQMWWNSTAFGTEDAHFGRDIGFFVFDYPWFRFVTGYAFSLLVVSIIAVALIHYIFGGIRLQGRSGRVSRAAQIHLSVLVGLAVLVRAVSYYLDRFGYAVGTSGLFDGIGYTDANARIPSRNILIGVAVVCAILFFVSIAIRSWVLPGIGLGLLLLTSILIGGIWPYVMQSFQVRPSEPDREGPYIARNIEATRDAYGVSGVEDQDYTASTTLTPQELAASSEERVSSRLIDPTLVAPAFEQLQQVRGYYTVPQTLDVDRYQVGEDEGPQDVIIAARELNLNGLQDSQRNWANDHTVYTHGYGVIAARGNQRGPQGEPVWVEKDIPPTGELDFEIPPRIYYGENSPSYSIVGRPEGEPPIEVDIPRGGGDDEGEENVTQNIYDGSGGVGVGNLFTKTLYAFRFAEPNIVLSDRVNEESKILYDRHPRDRVQKVAPWLTADGDVYPAVVDGRVVWIVDAYTTSDNYPYSEHRSLSEATADTLTQGPTQAVLPTDQVNYIRNSVKAVVDAYDGTVDLYEWDTEDPMLKTWMKVFPDSVTPREEISETLLAHMRYPVDLFKIQRDVLTNYHVTDALTFYEGGERWVVPEDPTVNDQTFQPPYYLSISTPGAETDLPQFSLTSVFTPNNRQNLASFVSVNSEATSENYGEMRILELPSDTQVPGPSQIANRFSADQGVTEALLQFRQSDAQVQNGNLLTLPVGEGLLYVQPVYIRRSAAEGTYPVLQFVAASFGEEVGFGQTLDEALRVALGLEEGNVGDEEPTDGEPGTGGGQDSGGSGGGQSQTTQEFLEDASQFYSEAQDALAEGDLSTYQDRIDAMNDAIEDAQEALGDGGSGGGDGG